MNYQNHCTNNRETIVAYVLGLLEQEEAAELQKHLETCRNCQSLYHAMLNEEKTIRSTFQMVADKGQVVQESLIKKIKQQNSIEEKSQKILPLKFRTILKSPLTKFAAVVIIITAFSAGMFLWNNTGSGIALADVLTRIEQVTAYMYQMRLTRTKTGQNITKDSESISTVLVSREFGIRAAYKRDDPNKGDIVVYDSYLLPPKKSIIFIDHKEKIYIPIKFEEGKIDYYKDEYNEPHTIIKQILACNHLSLGQSVIDGVIVEGFQTTDLAYKGGFFGQDDYFIGDYKKVDVKLWVDAETFLPVRLEEDVVTTAETHIHQICYDFRWNVILSAADFEPNIPVDYTSPIGDFIIPANNEENAIKGLRLYAGLAGHFPVSLKTNNLRSDAEKLMNYKGSDPLKGLSENEKTRKTSEFILLVMPGQFYGELTENNKEPAYYGETVGSVDSDKVLLRWNLEDGRYRVIFGDLSTKTVTTEELAELEKP